MALKHVYKVKKSPYIYNLSNFLPFWMWDIIKVPCKNTWDKLGPYDIWLVHSFPWHRWFFFMTSSLVSQIMEHVKFFLLLDIYYLIDVILSKIDCNFCFIFLYTSIRSCLHLLKFSRNGYLLHVASMSIGVNFNQASKRKRDMHGRWYHIFPQFIIVFCWVWKRMFDLINVQANMKAKLVFELLCYANANKCSSSWVKAFIQSLCWIKHPNRFLEIHWTHVWNWHLEFEASKAQSWRLNMCIMKIASMFKYSMAYK